MTLKQFFVGRTIGFIVVLILVGIFFAVKSYAPSFSHRDSVAETPQETNDVVSYERTITGTYTSCLPRHDNFSTEECRIGMKADDGSYYALDFQFMTQSAPKLTSGDTFTATGLFTPMEMISSDLTRGLIGKGILSVQKITLKL